MANLDLVGEMSLEQLHDKIENSYGKNKADELALFLRSVSISDSNNLNKLYAAVFSTIEHSNSIDNILSNPSKLTHIVTQIEKQIKQQEFQENKKTQAVQNNITNLLENSKFLENPTLYLQALSQEERNAYLEDFFDNLGFSEEDTKDATRILNSYISNPNDKVGEKALALLFNIEPKHVNEFVQVMLVSEENKKKYPNISKEEQLQFLKENFPNIDQHIFDKFEKYTDLPKEEQHIFVDKANNYTRALPENIRSQLSNVYSKYNSSISEENLDNLLTKVLVETDYDKAIKLLPLEEQEIMRNILKDIDELKLKEEHFVDKQDKPFTELEQVALDYALGKAFDKVIDLAEQEQFFEQEFDEEDILSGFETDGIDENSFDFPNKLEVDKQLETLYKNDSSEQKFESSIEAIQKAAQAETSQEPEIDEENVTNNYIAEIPEKQSIFTKLQNFAKSIIRPFTQKALPDPNATRVQHTNDSLDSFETRRSILSTIRSIGDKATQFVQGIISYNKESLEVKNPPIPVSGTPIKDSFKTTEMDEKPTDSTLKSEIIKPKEVNFAKPKSTFEDYISIDNTHNQIEASAKKAQKLASEKVEEKDLSSIETNKDEQEAK